MPTGRARDRDVLAQPGQDPVAQRAAVRRRGRVPLVAIAGRQQGDPKGRDLTGLDHRAGVAGERGELVVLGAVVGDQQRQLAFARRPHADCEVAAEHADRHLLELAARGALLEPGRRAVPGREHHRLVPERPGGALRVARVAYDHGVAVVIAQLELVLEAAEAAVGKMQHPAAVLTGEIGIGERQVGAQPDAREALLRVVDAEGAEHGAEGSR